MTAAAADAVESTGRTPCGSVAGGSVAGAGVVGALAETVTARDEMAALDPEAEGGAAAPREDERAGPPEAAAAGAVASGVERAALGEEPTA